MERLALRAAGVDGQEQRWTTYGLAVLAPILLQVVQGIVGGKRLPHRPAGGRSPSP